MEVQHKAVTTAAPASKVFWTAANPNTYDLMNPDPLEQASSREDPFPIDYPEGESPAFEETKASAGDQARQYASDLKKGSEDVFRSAKESGNSFVTEQKEKIASWLEEYYQVVEAGCERLESGEGNPLAAPAHRAASQLKRAANYLRSHQPGDFIDDVGAFARRRPELVYGGLFVAGLAATRFMKASARSRNESHREGREFGLAGVPQDFGPAETAAPRSAPLPDLVSPGPPPAFEIPNENTSLP